MWNRVDVKNRGKASFKRNYWPSVLVAIIFNLFFGATAASVANAGSQAGSTAVEGEVTPEFIMIAMAVLAVVIGFLTVAKIVDIFLLNPLEVGCDRFFVANQEANAQFGELGYAFRNNYIGAVLGIFLRDLILAIGYALFIVPGCILTYSYRLVPYILADEQKIGAIDALKKSREMMKGHKWNAFVYDLSFIGWFILSGFTFGLLGVFYVFPYKFNSDAALYQAIKRG